MKATAKQIAGIGIVILFSIFFVLSFVVFPETGEKILYGKHPPNKKSEPLAYSQIITSGNYQCIESASMRANGDLPTFVMEFNKCNS
ncbi:hypothetical protein AAA799B03_00649 [Marine Group I thaumarchaeote SCGC AAA799-B03]|uniref:Uncharacterized protein n=3 Tax=Marine Group I TaxID=905826 RepID=A0A087S7R1_9ARCH|nr:hypothetical protein AAA799D11_00437 [Marine Group I thaumarchaeote SCGC AAA799-D11]KFM18856.1 hypothetical protein SCCGRSA3_00885 [Marine Group I thaumarchaeote SCGC RSA3]KFM21765.1 hypothetical protein AAA799B03_00649 [Marine Group I thaumarchaeote SCGC AAA799-B03]